MMFLVLCCLCQVELVPATLKECACQFIFFYTGVPVPANMVEKMGLFTLRKKPIFLSGAAGSAPKVFRKIGSLALLSALESQGN